MALPWPAEILTQAARSNDFAIIILTADDVTVSRDVAAPAPRDNLIFELGWFMSAFGRRRSFFVVEEGVKTKIPSDLQGVIYTAFRRRERPQLTMGSTAFELQTAIQRSMANPDDSELAKEHSLKRSVVQLARMLGEDGFIPDLIVGVARGGLPAAGVLAEELGDDPLIPTVSILPDDKFRNDFNSYAVTRASFPGISGRQINILVVDNVRKSGRTLEAARTYLAGRLGERDFEIRTAAMTQYNGEYAPPGGARQLRRELHEPRGGSAGQPGALRQLTYECPEASTTAGPKSTACPYPLHASRRPPTVHGDHGRPHRGHRRRPRPRGRHPHRATRTATR